MRLHFSSFRSLCFFSAIAASSNIKFFEVNKLNARIEHSLLNAYILRYSTTGIKKYEDIYLSNFNRLGGCKFFEHKEVIHKKILKVTGCPRVSKSK